MDRENFLAEEESQTRRPYHQGTHRASKLVIGSADPVVKWGRPQPSAEVTEQEQMDFPGSSGRDVREVVVCNAGDLACRG